MVSTKLLKNGVTDIDGSISGSEIKLLRYRFPIQKNYLATKFHWISIVRWLVESRMVAARQVNPNFSGNGLNSIAGNVVSHWMQSYSR